MHEISLIESIIEIITAEMPKHNITRVEAIKLRIGEMRQVVPDVLLFGFEVLSKGTPLEGAELIVENVSMKGHCRICDQDFALEDWFSNCPGCGKAEYDIISGRELEIVEFEGV
jgi:hydrogenase nickel incorporation protein HypA/HybF